MPLVNHQQQCLTNEICRTFDKKSNCFGPVIPEKQNKVFNNWIRETLKMQKTCFYKKIKNYIAMAKSWGGGVFEPLDRSLSLGKGPLHKHIISYFRLL